MTGDNCSVDINECVSGSCQHNGTCVDTVDGYHCVCSGGHSGPNCDVPPCLSEVRVLVQLVSCITRVKLSLISSQVGKTRIKHTIKDTQVCTVHAPTHAHMHACTHARMHACTLYIYDCCKGFLFVGFFVVRKV